MSAHDLYALLDLDSTASVADIKRAYRERMMRCHPDVVLATTPPDASPAERSARESDAALTSQLLNRAWDTLRDPSRRSMYDAGRALFGADSRFARDAFTGVPLSENARPDLPLALFVDEGLCVGCRLCAMAAPRTFEMRPDLNVARVHTQWGDAEDDLEVAVASCPKDCIHSVEKRQLATLEWIHASQPRRRVNTCSGESMSGRGRGLEESPFVAMERFERRRREMQRDRELERERLERRAAAERAAERVSRVVGWSARAWRAVEEDPPRETTPTRRRDGSRTTRVRSRGRTSAERFCRRGARGTGADRTEPKRKPARRRAREDARGKRATIEDGGRARDPVRPSSEENFCQKK
jgi:curved DNA-binding protein CbpA